MTAATFTTEFSEFIKSKPTDLQWRNFASKLPSDAFSELSPYLFSTLEMPAVIETELSEAFQIFSEVNFDFRAAVANCLLSDAIIANKPTPATRTLLAALLHTSRASATKPDVELFIAMARHRAFSDHPIIGIKSLGDKVRDDLDLQVKRLFDSGTTNFVPAFTTVLSKPFSIYSASNEFENSEEPYKSDIAARDLKFRAQLAKYLIDRPATEQIRVEDSFAGSSILELLTDSLITAAFDASLPVSISTEIKNFFPTLLAQSVRRWSQAFEGWNWDQTVQSDYDESRAYNAEQSVRTILAKLGQSLLKDGTRIEILSVEIYEAYKNLLSTFGGWDFGDASEHVDSAHKLRPAVPSWRRNWSREAKKTFTDRCNIVECVPIHAFIRLCNRTRDPQLDPPNDRLGIHFSTDLNHAVALSEECLLFAQHQGLIPTLDFKTGIVLQSKTPLLDSTENYLGLSANGRATVEARVHNDFRRATALVTAIQVSWLGEIFYRQAGPADIVEKFSPQQETLLIAAARLYKIAISLFDIYLNNSWTIGLGLIGNTLEDAAKCVYAESLLRAAQLAVSDSSSRITSLTRSFQPLDRQASKTADWPTVYVDDLFERLKAIDQILDTLQTDVLDLAAEHDELESSLKESLLEVAKSEALRDVAKAYVEVEELTLKELIVEREHQKLRVAIAAGRQKEADYHLTALQFAVKSASMGTADAELGATLAKFEHDQVEWQIETLKKNIQVLQTEIPDLKNQIDTASSELSKVVSEAQEQHEKNRDKGGGMFSFVKKLASIVSVYFTGVDLVSVVETGIKAFKALKAGDIGTALELATDAANSIAPGKLSAFITDKLNKAEGFVENFMADSLADAEDVATKLESSMGISYTKSLTLATQGVAKQAFRIGVSYLAEEAGLKKVMGSLGVQPSAALIKDAKKQLLDTAFNAVNEQVDEVKKQAVSLLGGTADELRERIANKIDENLAKNISADETIIELIQTIRQNVSAADIAPLKRNLLSARTQLLNRLQQETSKPINKIEDALKECLDGITEAQKLLPPQFALPAEISDELNKFQAKITTAKQNLQFLTDPAAPEKLVNQLGQTEDDQQFSDALQSVQKQLRDGINESNKIMQDSQTDLANLKAKLANLDIESYRTEVAQERSNWQLKAIQYTEEQQKQLASEAAESLLTAGQELKGEQLGLKQVEIRLQAQKLVVKARKSQVEASENDVAIKRLICTRMQHRLSNWQLLYLVPDQDLIEAEETARLRRLELANSILIQSVQLLSIYEAPYSVLFGDSPGLTFLIPDRKTPFIKAALVDEHRKQWNQDLLANFRLLSSFNNLNSVLPERLKTKLATHISSLETQQNPPVKVRGRAGLKALLSGIRFQIMPMKVSTTPSGATIPAALIDPEAGNFFAPYAVPLWNVGYTSRVRLLGVVLQGNSNIFVYLTQECGYLTVRNPDMTQEILPLEIPHTTGETPLGIELAKGIFTQKQLETRPLFGIYTLRTDESQFSQVIDPDTFEATIHFVAVGTPG